MHDPIRYISADGLLTLLIVESEDGDIAIGFDGFPWRTHADTEASMSGLSEPDAVQAFVDRILQDQVVIALSVVDGKLQDAWPTVDPISHYTYKPANEKLIFRYWSGAKWPRNDHKSDVTE